MPLLYNHSQHPPRGFDFTDPSGVILNESSLYGLVTAVQKYRLNNGLPQGNPESEIEAIYATKYPWLVSSTQPAWQKPVKLTETPKEVHYAEWMLGIWKTQIKESELADDDVVDARLNKCDGCNHCVRGNIQLASGASSDVTRRLMILSKGSVTAPWPSCTLHNWHCGLAAMLREPKTDKEYDGCWAKK